MKKRVRGNEAEKTLTKTGNLSSDQGVKARSVGIHGVVITLEVVQRITANIEDTLTSVRISAQEVDQLVVDIQQKRDKRT